MPGFLNSLRCGALQRTDVAKFRFTSTHAQMITVLAVPANGTFVDFDLQIARQVRWL